MPASWREPDGIAPRGTLVLIPGRGEHPALFARFGRRIASDGYRVHVVADATQDAGLTAAQVADLLAAPARPDGGSGEAATAGSWEEELDTRTACPAHRAQLSGDALRQGALYEPVPAGWASWRISVPWPSQCWASTVPTTRSARWPPRAAATRPPHGPSSSASPGAAMTR